jgi:hypothetical protein
MVLNDLVKFGISPEALTDYSVIILPENIDTATEQSDLELFDTDDSILLSKLLKEKGVKCANSFDLGLEAKVIERRSVDWWGGLVWIGDKAVIPILTSIISGLLIEHVQKRPLTNTNSKSSTVHVDLRLEDGKLSASIQYSGDADTFLKVLKGLGEEPNDAGS